MPGHPARPAHYNDWARRRVDFPRFNNPNNLDRSRFKIDLFFGCFTMPQRQTKEATMSRETKASGTEPAGFVKRHPFEPMPGELGMNADQLKEAGLLEEGMSSVQGAVLELLPLIAKLKARRLSMGLSLTDVSRRSNMTRQAISKLENGQVINPTLETLYRYGLALDAGITLGFEEIQPDKEVV
jgi:DNA-binding XRE family transcriptional regulator